MNATHTIDATTFMNLAKLNHNAALCKKAAETLEQFAMREHAFVWIELPNRSVIHLEPGFKIKTAEYCVHTPMQAECY